MAIIRARSINFPVDVRTGPDSADYTRSLNLDDSQFRDGVWGEDSFRIGEILIDEEKRRWTLKSPKTDRMTGEKLVVSGDMTNVSFEELTPAQARKYYPHEFKAPSEDQAKPSAAAQAQMGHQGKQART